MSDIKFMVMYPRPRNVEAMRACAQSDGGKETLSHSVEISNGGRPVFLVAEDLTSMFGGGSVWDGLKALVSR